MALDPDHGESQHNLGKVLHKLGLADEAMARFRLAIAAGKGFLPRTAIATLIPGSPTATNATILDERRTWASVHLPPRDDTRSFPSPKPGRRIRIGYLSSFFEAKNWMKPVWAVVRNHDRTRFDLHLFSDAPLEQCRECYDPHPRDRFHDISALSNWEAAEQIERAELDVLVDLNGYSRVERLAVVALRPAPVVVGWFGLYATSGMAAYDYLIGDDRVIPVAEEAYCVETVLRVPGCYLTFDVSYATPDVADPPMLSAGQITFGSLASQYKITPPVVEAWSRILRRLPRARLFVKNKSLGSRANQDFLARRFEDAGVERSRLTLEGGAPHLEYLRAYDRADIVLDTFPYNGGTTTSEALWQGAPVLAFVGDRWASRQSASLLEAAGLGEFVARDVDDYVARAVGWGADQDAARRLTDLRRGMRERLRAASICDTAAFTASLERLYAHAIARESEQRPV